MEQQNQLRAWWHKFVTEVWRDHCAGRPLTPEGQRYAEILARYPQWAQYWAMGDDVGDAEIFTPEGIAPFAVVAMEVTVEGMLAEGGDPVVGLAYRSMRARGVSHGETLNELKQALLDYCWTVSVECLKEAEARHLFEKTMHRLAAGQKPRQVSTKRTRPPGLR